jgi:ribosomal protein L11 methyltransferase
VFAALGLAFASWTDVETGEARAWAFADSAAEAQQQCALLAAELRAWSASLPVPPPVPQVVLVEQEDWGSSWRRHFPAFRASRRLVVKPSWETSAAGPGDLVLELDPGMCFGTGYHGTTRACLEFLDDLAAQLGPVSFLDVGCGSGILSLAAARLGFWPLHAFDHDPQAVQVAADNLAAAGVTGVALVSADIGEYVPPGLCRVLAANVLAPVLIAHRDRLCSWLDLTAGTGYLILSGVLTTQYAELRSAFCGAGCRELSQRTLEEWTSGCFALDAGGPGGAAGGGGWGGAGGCSARAATSTA